MNYRKNLLCAFCLSIIALPCYSNLWLQPLYYADQQQAIGTLQAYSSNAWGILFAGDKKISEDATLGIGGSYVNVKQKYCNYPNAHTVVQNYLAILYGSIHCRQNMQLDWLVNGGINNYKQRYILTNSSNVSASFIGQQYLGRVIGSKKYQNKLMNFIPQINANVLYLHKNGYLENGIGLQRTASNAGVFTLGCGFKMSSVYARTKFKATPEVRCLVFYDILTADVNALTAFVIGGPALSTTATPERASGQFGASITAILHKNLNCSISYDLLLRNLYFNNVISLRFNYLIY